VQASTSQYVPSIVLSSLQTVNAQVSPLQVDEVVGPAQTCRCWIRVSTIHVVRHDTYDDVPEYTALLTSK
jgi:hypothetical protein